jgi:hypothetical protein
MSKEMWRRRSVRRGKRNTSDERYGGDRTVGEGSVIFGRKDGRS